MILVNLLENNKSFQFGKFQTNSINTFSGIMFCLSENFKAEKMRFKSLVVAYKVLIGVHSFEFSKEMFQNAPGLYKVPSSCFSLYSFFFFKPATSFFSFFF